MMAKERAKEFSCSVCMVDFEIKVEPSYDDEAVFAQYPKSVSWLNEVMACPVCGSDLEEKA